MGMLALLELIRPEKKLATVAKSLAGRARHTVWQRVSHRVTSMGVHEARGYVRARAAMVVHHEVDRAFEHGEVTRPAWRTRLVELTTDSVIHMVLAQARSMAPAYVPVPVRRAA